MEHTDPVTDNSPTVHSQGHNDKALLVLVQEPSDLLKDGGWAELGTEGAVMIAGPSLSFLVTVSVILYYQCRPGLSFNRIS